MIMSEIIESEYYNTTYVLYENNDTVASNEEPPKEVVEEKSSEPVAAQPRRAKKQEDQESLYDEDLYSLPKGAKTSETSETSDTSSKMDQRYENGKDKCSKSSMVIVGVVIGCLLAVAITTTCYVVLQKDTKGRQYNLWQWNIEFLIFESLFISSHFWNNHYFFHF